MEGNVRPDPSGELKFCHTCLAAKRIFTAARKPDGTHMYVFVNCPSCSRTADTQPGTKP